MVTGTFGYSIVGGTTVANTLSVNACRFLSPSNAGALTKITAYLASTSGTIHMKAGLYADSLGVPAALLAQSAETDVTATAGWVDFTVSYTCLPNTYYWLAFVSVTGANYSLRYDAGLFRQTNQTGYAGLPDPFDGGSSYVYQDWKISVYATYTAAAVTSWGITSSLLSVNLPLAPKVLDDAHPVQIDEVNVDGGASVLISRFTRARKLTLQGSLYVAGYTNYALYISYLEPLIAMKRQQVTITDPDSQFGGYWLMGEPVFHREAEGTVIRYTYSIPFLQGQSIVMVL